MIELKKIGGVCNLHRFVRRNSLEIPITTHVMLERACVPHLLAPSDAELSNI